jgi:hypothetical protein
MLLGFSSNGRIAKKTLIGTDYVRLMTRDSSHVKTVLFRLVYNSSDSERLMMTRNSRQKPSPHVLHTQPTQAQGVILHVFHYHVVSDNGTQKRLIYYTLLLLVYPRLASASLFFIYLS